MSKATIDILSTRKLYVPLLTQWSKLSEPTLKAYLRELYRADLYALLRFGLRRKDTDTDWCFERCREVQRGMDGYLDLWAREHYKSTILTFAGSIFRIINDPEVTIGIFSHTKPIAKGFLRQIKFELESNDHLKLIFDDILWQNPRKEASKWTEDEGITVKRRGNPKEATVEAHGLVDGQPTSKHFRHRQYDDVVTLESVTTPDMIAKTTAAYEMSDNLGTEGGTFGVVGTRYHFADTYGDLVKRGSVKSRVYPCTKDGTDNFAPENCVLMKPETLAAKRLAQGPYTFGTQMLLNPKGDDLQGFRADWIRTWRQMTADNMPKCILVDAASEKRPGNDYTAAWVLGFGSDRNIYALDMVRDRLNLKQRADMLFALHRKWMKGSPSIAVGYEKYGMMADVEFMRGEMERRQHRFVINELGGQMPKRDRIRRLMPYFERNEIYLPERLMRTDYEQKTVDLVSTFIEEEYKAFPVSTHDDMLDALARVFDLYPQGLPFPMELPGGRNAFAAYDEFGGGAYGSQAETHYSEMGGAW